jgi:hypothetical protein
MDYLSPPSESLPFASLPEPNITHDIKEPFFDFYLAQSLIQDRTIRDDAAQNTPMSQIDASSSDTIVDQAFDLVRIDSSMWSCQTSSEFDLKQTPPALEKSGISLWEHQLAAVGRMEAMLKKHNCALLAYEMGLGETFIIIGR